MPSPSVLIIDDEPDIREVVCVVLKDAGFQVMDAENGIKGLELAGSWCPHIVLTDLRMPEMNGLEVLKRLKNGVDDIEVVVVTAFAELDLAIQALQLDASDFITKPLREDALKLALKRAMNRFLAKRKLKEYARHLEQENINQAKLLHKDKLISLGRLSASVVHEINNPLAGILNYARLMNRMIKKESITQDTLDRFSRYLDLIESESARLSAIVSSLLTFSRKTSPQISTFKVRDLLDKCVLLCQHRLSLGNIALIQNVDDHIPLLAGDFNQLQQCIITLIFNSIDAMPDGGTLSISAGRNPGENQIVIQVKDTGTGIAKEHLNKIFEPFFTTKDEGYGVGLGLSILFGIIEQHHGSVDVVSEPGKGACFTLKLPVA